MSFGHTTEQIITLNLPDGIIPNIVRLCLSFSLFFTYPGMFNVYLSVFRSFCLPVSLSVSHETDMFISKQNVSVMMFPVVKLLDKKFRSTDNLHKSVGF